MKANILATGLQPGPARPARRQAHDTQRRLVLRVQAGRAHEGPCSQEVPRQPQEVCRASPVCPTTAHTPGTSRATWRSRDSNKPARIQPGRVSSTGSASWAKYDAAGLTCLPVQVGYDTFGKTPETSCNWFLTVKDGKFKVLNGGKPITSKLFGDPKLIAANRAGTATTTTTDTRRLSAEPRIHGHDPERRTDAECGMTSSTESRRVEARLAVPSTRDGDDNWQLAATVLPPRGLHAPRTSGRSRRHAGRRLQPSLLRSSRSAGYSEARYHNRWRHDRGRIGPPRGRRKQCPSVRGHDARRRCRGKQCGRDLDPRPSSRRHAGSGCRRVSILRASSAPASRWVGTSLPVCRRITERSTGSAMLGSSMVCTSMPSRPGRFARSSLPRERRPRRRPRSSSRERIGATRFFWEDVPESFVEADFAGGHPVRETAPIWGSTTVPGLAAELVLPGVVAAEAASIDVPVLVGMGERDVCQDPHAELAAFKNATDIGRNRCATDGAYAQLRRNAPPNVGPDRRLYSSGRCNRRAHRDEQQARDVAFPETSAPKLAAQWAPPGSSFSRARAVFDGSGRSAMAKGQGGRIPGQRPGSGDQGLNQMMKQIQKMQADMEAAQEALAAATRRGAAGGGVVKATVTGDGELQSGHDRARASSTPTTSRRSKTSWSRRWTTACAGRRSCRARSSARSPAGSISARSASAGCSAEAA